MAFRNRDVMQHDNNTANTKPDPRRLAPEMAAGALDDLLATLDAPADRQRDWRDMLMPLAHVVHLNIAWYERAVRRERWWQLGYLAAGIGLALFVPFFVQMFAENGVGVAALAALFVGLFVLYRTFSALLVRRQAMGSFWAAASALKKRLYEFEDTWRGTLTQGRGPTPDFVQAVENEIQAARIIRDQEQQRFFRQFDSPPSLAGKILGVRNRDPQAQATARAATQRIQAEMTGLDGLIKKREQQLDETEDEDDATQIQTSLTALDQRRQVLELTLLKEQAMLERGCP
jgi:hypothetical protein